jgi:hypothetical protein
LFFDPIVVGHVSTAWKKFTIQEVPCAAAGQVRRTIPLPFAAIFGMLPESLRIHSETPSAFIRKPTIPAHSSLIKTFQKQKIGH